MGRITIRRLVWWVVGCIGLSVVATVAVTGVVLHVSAPMRDVTHGFLGAIRFGRADMAWAWTSAGLRARVPPADFASLLERNASNVPGSRSEFINGFSGDTQRQCMEVWVTGSSGWPSTIYVILVEETDGWRVDDFMRSGEPGVCHVD